MGEEASLEKKDYEKASLRKDQILLDVIIRMARNENLARLTTPNKRNDW